MREQPVACPTVAGSQGPCHDEGSASIDARKPSFRVERYIWAVLLAWTIITGSSLAWNVSRVNTVQRELAREQARVGHEKDVLYRRWNTTRSPVYVAENDQTPPNPYLGDVPERDISTPSGKPLTMMNPAYMTRQVHEIGKRESGVRGHITSLNPIRHENAPDPWEAEALKAFDRGQTEVSDIQELDGREHMRLMRPLTTERGCLKCHAEQGYRVGDIRGGISVSIPMDPFRAAARTYIASLSIGHSLIWLVGAFGIVLGGQRLRANRDVIEAQNVRLIEHGRRLQEACDLLDAELRSVGEVQASLLPAQIPAIPGFESATHYQPAKRAGGDYFDVFALPEGQWGVLVADVSGHGASAAVVMAMTHAMLRIAATKVPAVSVLKYLNQALAGILQSDQFVTCCYGVLDPASRQFTFALAGHPPPLVFDSSTGRVCAPDGQHGLPLGVLSDTEFAESSVTLEPGDLVLLYTDGITEAFNADQLEFGLPRLINELKTHGPEGAEAARKAVLAALDEHRGAVELADDITLVVLRVMLSGLT